MPIPPAQDTHSPAQALLQQKPEAQIPLRHVAPLPEHIWPLIDRQLPEASHCLPVAHTVPALLGAWPGAPLEQVAVWQASLPAGRFVSSTIDVQTPVWHVTLWHVPVAAGEQSLVWLQCFPTAHGPQFGPPQSTSVSPSFWMLS
jgi:hypothetical protein